MKRIMVCLAMLALGWVAPRMAAAECCDQCGCQCQCCKTCRLVPDVKKVPKVTYACECEDICIPGPSCLLGYKCETDDDCECGHHTHREPIWQPTCGRVITRHKLVKIQTMKEVAGFKCVVVDLCPKCGAQTEAQNKQVAEMVAKQATQTSVAEAPAVKAADTQVELAADPADAAEGQLVSHETKSPNFVDRLKRSFQPILGR